MLAKEKYGIRGREMSELNAKLIRFSAQTRMSGVEFSTTSIRKGAVDAILNYLNGGTAPSARGAAAVVLKPGVNAETAREIQAIAETIAKSGGTPLAVARDGKLLGVIHLKDIVKGGIRERFAEFWIVTSRISKKDCTDFGCAVYHGFWKASRSCGEVLGGGLVAG